MDETLNAVASCVRSVLGDEAVALVPQTDVFDDLGFDSLRFVVVVANLSKLFEFDIDDIDAEALGRVRSVGDLVAMVRTLKD